MIETHHFVKIVETWKDQLSWRSNMTNNPIKTNKCLLFCLVSDQLHKPLGRMHLVMRKLVTLSVKTLKALATTNKRGVVNRVTIWRSSLTFSRVQPLLSMTSGKGNMAGWARHMKFSHGYIINSLSNSITYKLRKIIVVYARLFTVKTSLRKPAFESCSIMWDRADQESSFLALWKRRLYVLRKMTRKQNLVQTWEKPS